MLHIFSHLPAANSIMNHLSCIVARIINKSSEFWAPTGTSINHFIVAYSYSSTQKKKTTQRFRILITVSDDLQLICLGWYCSRPEPVVEPGYYIYIPSFIMTVSHSRADLSSFTLRWKMLMMWTMMPTVTSIMCELFFARKKQIQINLKTIKGLRMKPESCK